MIVGMSWTRLQCFWRNDWSNFPKMDSATHIKAINYRLDRLDPNAGSATCIKL
jgi:hypothetical protein